MKQVTDLVQTAVKKVNEKNERQVENQVENLVNNILSIENEIAAMKEQIVGYKKTLKELQMPELVTLVV